MSAPWMKFYPRDWRGDQALRAVSLSARGLWIECLCIMHEAKPYGHLVLNGSPVDGDTLARMTGVPVDEVSALLAELRQAGVLSVTGKGVVFSRRMTKDHARAQKGQKAANKRWSQTSDGVEQSGEPNGLPNRDPTTQKPYTISPREQPRADGMLYDKLINAASSRGPCHPNLGMNIHPVVAAMKAGYDLERDLLPIIREKARPDVSSWNFFIRIAEGRAAENARIIPKPTEQQADWTARLDAWRATGTWGNWGPKPGEKGCKVPPHLLESKAA